MLQQLNTYVHKLHGHKLESFLLESFNDVADDVSVNSVRLHGDESPLPVVRHDATINLSGPSDSQK